jgi:hypothetical protein
MAVLKPSPRIIYQSSGGTDKRSFSVHAKWMMGETGPGQRRTRNNNLAGYAIVCFMIGGPLLQISIGFLPFIMMFPGSSIAGFIVMAAIGAIICIVGVYFLISWFNSDKPQMSRFA